MTNDEELIFTIKGMISTLSAAEREAANELADHMRKQLTAIGEPAGTLVLALLGAEA